MNNTLTNVTWHTRYLSQVSKVAYKVEELQVGKILAHRFHSKSIKFLCCVFVVKLALQLGIYNKMGIF